METAKEIAESYTRDMMDSERLKSRIIGYTKQEVKERDKQWLNTMINLGHLTDTDLINEVNKELPEPKFE